MSRKRQRERPPTPRPTPSASPESVQAIADIEAKQADWQPPGEPISDYHAMEQAVNVLADNIDPDYVPPGFGEGLRTNPSMSHQPPPSNSARVLDSIRERLGKTTHSNRTCPACGKQTFKVARSEQQEDGSIRRERQCAECGHVEERLAPAETPLNAEC